MLETHCLRCNGRLQKKQQLICFVRTMNCLLESFKNKGLVYLDVILRKKTVLVQDAMINCCRDKDKYSFEIMNKELDSIEDKYYYVLGSSETIVRRIKRNSCMMSVFLFFLQTSFKNNIILFV